MTSGITIAFVCCKKHHSTVQNFNSFGHKYWDDTLRNKSKIGYYFIYYYQKKYVYVHKIINILQPSQRPLEMLHWITNRQILCLSERLQTYSWHEWINGTGKSAPYTPNYYNTQTCSWSYLELKTHKDFRLFNFINFENDLHRTEICDNTGTLLNQIEDIYEPKEEPPEYNTDEEADLIITELEKELENLRAKKREKELQRIINCFRDNRIADLKTRQCEIEQSIENLKKEVLQLDIDINETHEGKYDYMVV
jgi:hypothetical protein